MTNSEHDWTKAEQGVFKGCLRGEQVWNKYGTRVNQGRTRWVQGGTKAEPRGKKKKKKTKIVSIFIIICWKFRTPGFLEWKPRIRNDKDENIKFSNERKVSSLKTKEKQEISLWTTWKPLIDFQNPLIENRGRLIWNRGLLIWKVVG